MKAKANGRWIDRRTAAALVSAQLFPTTKRSLERWPIAGRLLNGKVVLREEEVLAHAHAMLDRAPATPAPRLRKDR